MKNIWKSGLLIAFVLLLGTAASGRADCKCETVPGPCDSSCTCEPCEPCNPCNPCEPCNPCNPCDCGVPESCNPCNPCNLCDSSCLPEACNPCGSCCGVAGLSSPLKFSGWLDLGIYTNSHGNRSNGPMFTSSKQRTDFVMNQLYLSAEKEMNTRCGFDWGARADVVYGAHAGSMQTWGDHTFDDDWGTNRHGYSMSAYQLYGTIGYKDLSVKAGKFGTPIGWEASASKDNFFYSHSYCYWIEPATHTGVLADYTVSDDLTVSGGWTTGEDSSFENPYGNSAVLTGFTYALANDLTAYYWVGAGKQYCSPVGRFLGQKDDYYMQSLVFEWALTKRLTYVNQYNLRNDNLDNGGVKERHSTYGVNNHLLYKLNDKWGVGTRFEWLRNNGGYIADDNNVYQGNFYQATLGVNWNPCENLSIRPEVRYDWCGTSTPFANGTRSDQVSAGLGMVMTF